MPEVNRTKSGAGPTEQSGLLGFRIDEEGTIEIGNRAIQRLKESVHKLWDARQSKTSQQLRQQWQSYITGWWNYFQLAARLWNVKDISGWIRRHMRKCFWQRWHNRNGRRKALQRLGIRGKALQLASCSQGAWRRAKHWVVNTTALKNRTLHRYGLIIPWQDAVG